MEFRDLAGEFSRAGAVIAGISRDSLYRKLRDYHFE
jgi:peroxiredoxin